MGEIGINREEFLHGLKLWELNAIIKGYRRREQTSWNQTRWLAYVIMCRIPAGKSMNEVGIRRPEDLLPLPWDKGHQAHPILPTEDEVEEMQALMHKMNSKEDTNKQQE